LDPAVPAPDVSALTTWYEREVEKPRLHLLILALFAIAGLAIATTGLYGVVAYTVAQRTHEFGVRVALGARPSDVLQLVMRQEIPLIATGIALGTGGAFATSRLLTTLLYGVRPGDIATHAAACLLLSAVALFGCYLPARRAARLDPAASLRNE
jgi:putative ABC transport system permease protein